MDVLDIRDILSGVYSMLAAFRGWRRGVNKGVDSEMDGVYQEYPDRQSGGSDGYRK